MSSSEQPQTPRLPPTPAASTPGSGRFGDLLGSASRRLQESLKRPRPQPSKSPMTLLSSPLPRTPLSVATPMAATGEAPNVDALLRSLYTLADSTTAPDGSTTDPSARPWASPSSFLPHLPSDWLLDGRSDWRADAVESQRLLRELQRPADLLQRLLLTEPEDEAVLVQALREAVDQLPRVEENTDYRGLEMASSSSSSPPSSSQEEDEFGDFQSASTVAETHIVVNDDEDEDDNSERARVCRELSDSMLQNQEGEERSIDASGPIGPASQDGVSPEGVLSASTTGLLERVDALLLETATPNWGGPLQYSPSPPEARHWRDNSPDTFRLVDHTESVLFRASQSSNMENTNFEGCTPNEEKKHDPLITSDVVCNYETPLRHDRSEPVDGPCHDRVGAVDSSDPYVGMADRQDQLKRTPTTSMSSQSEPVVQTAASVDARHSLDEPSPDRPVDEIQFIVKQPTAENPPLLGTSSTGSIDNCDIKSGLTPLRNGSRVWSDGSFDSRSGTPLPENDGNHAAKLSLQLPIHDLTSPAARFLRRHQCALMQQEKPPSSVTEPTHSAVVLESPTELVPVEQLDLPLHFFAAAPTSDDTVRLLDGLPWQLLEEHRREYDSWDEFMVEKLCKLDHALQQMNGHALREIQPRQIEIAGVNELIHELEQNLRLSIMYQERSQRAIQLAWGDEDEGTGLVLHTILSQRWDERNNVREVGKLLASLDELFRQEQKLMNRIEEFDTRESDALNEYVAVTKFSKELESTVNYGSLQKLSCLDGMRSRLRMTDHRFWKRLLRSTESFVVRQCHASDIDWIEYERILEAALELHSNTRSRDFPLSNDWHQSIVFALNHETDRSLAIALLAPSGVKSSNLENELQQLRYEVDRNWGDSTALRTIIHNLVSIRFSFGSDNFLLSRVLCRLFERLVKILHSYLAFIRYHSSPPAILAVDGAKKRMPNHEHLDEIHRKLVDSSEAVWSKCESVVIHCLDEYIQFAKMPKLFQDSKSGTDDSVWRKELACLHECLILTSRFTSFKNELLGGLEKGALESQRSFSAIFDKLSDIFRQHLQCVHIEAMTSMGRMLAAETWAMTEFNVSKDHYKIQGTDYTSTIEPLLRDALEKACSSTLMQRRTANFIAENPPSRCASDRNPFDMEFKQVLVDCSVQMYTKVEEPRVGAKSSSTIYLQLGALTDTWNNSKSSERSIAPRSITAGLVEWLGRLLDLFETLPLISGDIAAVSANICDLFFTTVFRVCSGSSKAEDVLLGKDLPIPSVAPTPINIASSNPIDSPLFGSFRKSSLPSIGNIQRPQHIPQIPSLIMAEICSPPLRDKRSVLQLQRFVKRAHSSLQDIVNLDKVDKWLAFRPPEDETMEEFSCRLAQTLERRMCALWGCFVAAALGDVFCCLAREKVSSFYLVHEIWDDMCLMESYMKEVIESVPALVSIGCQYSCVCAIGGHHIVSEILEVGSDWEASSLNERHNDYIEDLNEQCSLLWGFLFVSGKLPRPILAYLWERLLSAAYLSLLEGFSRVPFCSTEGRALMALDLASLRSGTSPAAVMDQLEGRSLIVQEPPPVDVNRWMAHVDMYIKVFYFPVEDALTWIKSNCEQYHLNHLIALIVAVAGPGANETSSLVETVRNYHERANSSSD